MLGAYYYLWYGKPNHPILGAGEWKSGYTNSPILGEYNSRDPEIIKQHLNWAREAGIDFLAMNWYGPETWEDITLKNYYLPVANDSEIKFCIHYDSYLALHKLGSHFSYDFKDSYSPAKTKGEKFLEDFEYLANTYFNSPQYLKIQNKPVVILYNAFVFQNFSDYLEKLKNILAKKGINIFLIADAVSWTGLGEFISKKQFKEFLWNPVARVKGLYQVFRRLSPATLGKKASLDKNFDAITGYNLFAPDKISGFLEKVDKTYRKFFKYALSQNLYFIPSIMPGYDDSRLRYRNQQILKRENGEFYKKYWQVARKYLDPKLKIVLLTSFNEWHEGTEIEPSKEYGENYLQMTQSFAREIK